MQAAILVDDKPQLAEVATDGDIAVTAAALSQFSKSRSTGAHYSSSGAQAIAGADGVGRTADGRRVYFVLPENGSLAERARARHTVAIPDHYDDVTAAALANPGMSAYVALVRRAKLQPGETVLVNGATGSAGRLAVQHARHLGAGRIIAASRSGADVGADLHVRLDELESVVRREPRLDVVIDYLYGSSALAIIIGIARAEHATRFIAVGEASREPVNLPGAALRSSAITLMGSGLKSVPFDQLLDGVVQTFALPGLSIPVATMPLARIAEAWEMPGTPRIVVVISS